LQPTVELAEKYMSMGYGEKAKDVLFERLGVVLYGSSQGGNKKRSLVGNKSGRVSNVTIMGI